ncbi:MAG: ABC transporter ATP-binding protein [Candidatus Rokuibacteriota bacterium]|nr:MAG: ABC transporter ATP-binding protein [Candidatus Rokubacteria bacterium]
MLEVEDIHTNYGESYVLQGVSLRVDQGEVVAVLGRNGVGKSTLIRSLIGLTPPRRGRVLLKGEDITRLPAHEIARRGVGLVPQGRRIFASLAVGEHLQIGERPGNGSGWSLPRVLDLFPRLRERLHNRGNKLSGGEQQMLACGRALVGNPDILLMDEPSEGLAPILVRELGRILAQLKTGGASILLVEQNLAFALRIADRVYLMSKGKIVHESRPDELRRDEEVKARYLGV